ncbi:short-chain dehydrogenase [Xylona heveae TC161]|uniref:Short-chain dehydrogenase n=1 Tax=Xylona heveae (strain CBS 132557 / TC161) TaxID=1328760 RepID=A0A165FQ81_XYLHT|nr:short-chain dehydrogenase [Xylona heveae TC161]KZF21249.1 short-chain dehydrogenase [Xylona heveae TC161]
MAPNKVIILTGASRGIGQAVAQYLLSPPRSHNVVVLARSKAPLEALQKQYPEQVQVVAGDLAGDFSLADKAVQVALDTWGRVDALIVNHGVLDPVRRIADADIDAWRRAYDVNVFGAVAFAKAALPALRESQGRIVFTSSGAANSGYVGWGAYGSSKAAINHLAKTLANEEPSVTSVALRPGVVDTEMQTDIRGVHTQYMDAKEAEKFSKLKNEGGLLKPEQPGTVIANLALKAPKELSGQFVNWSDEELKEFQA